MDRPDWTGPLLAAMEAAIAHLDGLPDAPVGATVDALTVLDRIDVPVPQAGEPAEDVVSGLLAAAEGGITRMNSGRFFGWVIGGSTPAGLAADWLVSAWEQNTGMLEPTPAAATLEHVAAQWCRELLHLPDGAAIGFVTGGQMANWVGLAAGRHAVLKGCDWDVEQHGLQGAPLVHAVIGEEAHSTVTRALRFLGLGEQTASRVATDDQGRMRPGALDKVLAGLDGPVLVALQAGNVNSGAVDPIDQLMDVVDDHRGVDPTRLWVHLDGAFGLWAAASHRHAHLLAGHDRCDSWGTDAHKWLNVPYDCGIAAVRDPGTLRHTLGMHASYLPDERRTRVPSPIDLTPEASRRARGVPVYATIRSLGAAGIEALVDRCCAHARRFGEQLSAIPGIDVLNDVVLNQVVVAFDNPGGTSADEHATRVADLLWADGTCVATKTTWRGRPGLRISVSNWTTDDQDVDRSVEALRRAHAAAATPTTGAGSPG